ncbi:MAG: hypothetical protein HY042_04775 [Spirochaetia bacterium]|nr:hypothetical protein [Spirochaetia bacterium]
MALELPEDADHSIHRVMPFLDQIPVISTTGENPVHLIFEPLEPLVEAARSAFEGNIPFYAVDLPPSTAAAWIPDSFPDTYALQFLTIPQIYELYKRYAKPGDESSISTALLDELDRIRELYMASRIRRLSLLASPDTGGLLVVCGIRHAAGLERLLKLTDEAFQSEFAAAPEAALLAGSEAPNADPLDEEPMEALLKQSEQKLSGNWDVSVLSRESPEVLSQPGYYNTAWIMARKQNGLLNSFNRVVLQRSAYREAVNRYERESGELVPPQREKLYFQFARNWSLIEKKLLPDLFRLVMSARAFFNDNFARIMYDVLNYLPKNQGSPFPELKLTLDDIFRDSRLIRFRLKMRLKKRVPPPKIIRRFKREKYPGDHAESKRDL